ncbi:helix-turn-helix domain-containing protein [Lactiplantibacillus plantarum]|uniref:helix-turn-helix domain-containing protein n=1 Tax=Lactiplantibacillus plantarum TaxID=1590 RepID=UPI00097751AC|nr:helix-turn-helix domain-containing protein [Lactiplantibacillus plantarum]MCW6139503.1 helix-turn-helix domain-containing protein [Lactiplantibacillus plantarum]
MGIFAERLKEAMQQANITSAQLAKQTGIGRSSISQWLSSKYVAKHDKVTALATVLNVSPDWLLGTTDIATAATPEAVPIPVAVTPPPAVDPELMTLWEQLDTKQRAKLIKKARKLIAKSTEQPNAKQKKDKKKKKGKKRK